MPESHALIGRRAAIGGLALGAGIRPALAVPDDGAGLREAAIALLAGVAADRRTRLALPFAAPDRHRWSFVPGRRAGLPVSAMPDAERGLAFRLLAAALSESGYAKATGVMRLAEVLRQTRSFGGGPGAYAFALFGDPAGDLPWGLRVEGHHLSLNVTLHGDRVLSATPHAVCADPMAVQSGPHAGLMPIDREDYMGRSLARSLDPTQLARATQPGAVPVDIAAGPGQAGRFAEPRGIAFRELTDETQTHLMLGLAETYLSNLPTRQRRAAMARLAGPARDELRFVWSGGFEPADEHYYCLQGPTLLIEFSTRRRADHVHTVWREPGNDFGRAALAAAGFGPLPPDAA